jgi:signal transduction histidine kinase
VKIKFRITKLLTYQLNTRIKLEDFARDQRVGIVILADGVVDFETGLSKASSKLIVSEDKVSGRDQISGDGGQTFYVASAHFSPWNWQIFLAKDAGDFQALVSQVRQVYISSGLALLAAFALMILALRQFLVLPIYQIAEDFSIGSTLRYRGIAEFEHLSTRIGDMMQTLRTKTQELEMILQSMSDAIAVFDSDMRLSVWNRQYATLYQYPDQLLRQGTHFAEIMRYNIDRGDYGSVDPEQQIAVIVERARSLSPPRFEIDRADGTSVEVRRAPMPDGGFVTTYTDITYQKQSARLAAANEAKSQFLENISHDLRKPIAAVIEDCRLLLTSKDRNVDPPTRAVLDNVSSNATHLLGMVDELLEMARIEAGQVVVISRPTTLHAVINQAMRAMAPAAKAKGLNLIWEAGHDADLLTDTRLLSRVLMNLVGNAIEYTDKGSVAIAAQRRSKSVTITVSDTGRGIASEKLELIFGKFQRVDETSGLTKPGVGLGLGLAICREFTRLLGGDVVVESKLGSGSVFTLRFPATFKEKEE